MKLSDGSGWMNDEVKSALVLGRPKSYTDPEHYTNFTVALESLKSNSTDEYMIKFINLCFLVLRNAKKPTPKHKNIRAKLEQYIG